MIAKNVNIKYRMTNNSNNKSLIEEVIDCLDSKKLNFYEKFKK